MSRTASFPSSTDDDGRRVVVDRVRERITELVSESTTETTQWLLRPPWAGLRPYPHTVEHPSLIDQLRECFPDGSSRSSGGVPSSRPAANLTTIEALQMITVEARRWVEYGLRAPSRGVVADLGLLRSRAATLEQWADLSDLDWHVTRWWTRARVVTTWDTAPLRPFVPCDQCGSTGTLRIVLEPLAALCLECGAAWDRSTIGVLGEHVQLMLSAPIPDTGLTGSTCGPEVGDAPDVPRILHGVSTIQ